MEIRVRKVIQMVGVKVVQDPEVALVTLAHKVFQDSREMTVRMVKWDEMVHLVYQGLMGYLEEEDPSDSPIQERREIKVALVVMESLDCLDYLD